MLKKASKDKDERMNKIKAVAVKAKKELDHSKKEVCGVCVSVSRCQGCVLRLCL